MKGYKLILRYKTGLSNQFCKEVYYYTDFNNALKDAKIELEHSAISAIIAEVGSNLTFEKWN